MDSLSFRTVFATKESAQKGWVLLDAEGKTLGRFASEAAKILRGKNGTIFLIVGIIILAMFITRILGPLIWLLLVGGLAVMLFRYFENKNN